MRALLDTSVFIARERCRPLGQLPDDVAVSVPIDEPVGDEFARLRVELKATGKAMKVMDGWIAATAMAHGAAVCTQDADFDAAAGAGLVEVVRV